MNPELARRIAFTIGALLVYRLGTYIPLPGIDPAKWRIVFEQYGGEMLGAVARLSGGGVSRLAVFSLGILPYVTAAILLQIATFVVPSLKAIAGRGDSGRATIHSYTLYVTIALAAFQGLGIAIGLEGVSDVVANPGWFFRFTTMLTLTAGTLFLVWLADQITRRGIGNGIALLLFCGVLIALGSAAAWMIELQKQGALSSGIVTQASVAVVVLTGFIVVMERARWNLVVIAAAPVAGAAGGRSLLPIKLNSAGLVPALLASWLMTLLIVVAGYVVGWQSGRATWLLENVGHGRPLYIAIYGLLVFFGVLIYTAFVLDPEAAADTLKARGATIEGIESGEPTADYLDGILSRISLVGAAYFTAICLIPEILIAYTKLPFYFASTSLLIVVCTVMDLVKQGGAHWKGKG